MALRAVVDHPKFTRLKALLRLNRACTLGYLEALWHFTGRFTPQGNIGKYSDADIEAWMEWDGEEGELIAALVKARWLDVHDRHRLLVHDWHKHADDATRNALRRANLIFAALEDIEGNESECPKTPVAIAPTSEHEATAEAHVATESQHVATVSGQRSDGVATESVLPGSGAGAEPGSGSVPEGARAAPPGKPSASEVKEAWSRFIDAYPKRSGSLNKAEAERKFTILAKNGQDVEPIILGAQRYREWAIATGKFGTELVAQMTTWLNQRRWSEDYEIPISEPAARPSGPTRVDTVDDWRRIAGETLGVPVETPI